MRCSLKVVSYWNISLDEVTNGKINVRKRSCSTYKITFFLNNQDVYDIIYNNNYVPTQFDENIIYLHGLAKQSSCPVH